MKTLQHLTLLALALLAGIAAGAQAFTYTYDASGNRVKREVQQPALQQNEQQAAVEVANVKAAATLTPLSDSLSQDAFKLMLYPNPTNGAFTLELPELKPGETGSLLVYGLMGHRLIEQQVVRSLQSFDIRGAIPGYYLVRVTIGDKVVSKKLVKQ